MTWAPTRLCSATGCGEPSTVRGRCATHQRAQYRRIERDRGSSTSRGYDADWRRVREQLLKAEPLCRHCERTGVLTLAREVDHILPLADGGARLELSNLQPLCGACHAAKTAGEHSRRGPT